MICQTLWCVTDIHKQWTLFANFEKNIIVPSRSFKIHQCLVFFSQNLKVVAYFTVRRICGHVGREGDLRSEGLWFDSRPGSRLGGHGLGNFCESHTLPLCVIVRNDCQRILSDSDSDLWPLS